MVGLWDYAENMNIGKVIVWGVVGVIVLGMVRGLVVDLKRQTPPKTSYILRASAEISPDQSQMLVRNTNNFLWPKPAFTINGMYRLEYQSDIQPGEVVPLPLGGFVDREGNRFGGVQQFHKFDIRTATMAWKGRQ